MDTPQDIYSPPEFFDREERYRILDVLGTGNFGVVYRVYDKQWSEQVALKTTRENTPEQKQWLKEEYRIQSDIVHPVLVPPDELRTEGERSYFTMKLVEAAVPFNRYFNFAGQLSGSKKSISIEGFCRAALELTEALQTIHSHNRCHGDIKPENVLVTDNGHVALLDFGLMRSTNDSLSYGSDSTGLMGTPDYLAPEYYEGMAADADSDWYALGLMLYESLAGKPAFSGDALEVLIAKQMAAPSIAEKIPGLAPPLARLIDSMIDPVRENRPLESEIVVVLREHASCNSNIDELGDNVWESNLAHLEDGFIARDAELDVLNNTFAETTSGAFRLLEITGPSGIGKTALVRNFLETIQASDAAVIFRAKCLPQESIPYKAFDGIIDGLINYLLDLDPSRVQEMFSAESFSAAAILFPDLNRLDIFRQLETGSDLAGDPRALRAAGFDSLRQLFCKIAETDRLVFWVDDSQWADSDSAALLESVFGHAEAAAALLLMTRRPDRELTENVMAEAVGKISAECISQIDLQPLTATSSESLVKSIISDSNTGDGSIAHIIEQSAGLPYLISELAHYAKSQGGKYLPKEQTPNRQESGHSILADRLTTLPLENRVIVELAAVAAAPLAPTVIMRAAESGQRSRLRDLSILRLLKWTTDGARHALQIYHDHLREFVVSNLSPEILNKRHAALLYAMEQDGGYDAESLLPHALASQNRARIRIHASSAANRASETLAFEQAARFFEIAIATYDEGDRDSELLAHYADALANAGRSTEAAPAYERASSAVIGQDSKSAQTRDALRRRAGEQYLKSGHFEEGLRIMSAFLAEKHVKLPKSGKTALLVSSSRRLRLYLGGLTPKTFASDVPFATVTRLDDLWAATTALSMMDPVRADAVGLLHFIEAIKARDKPHVARSLGYEAAFAALIGGDWLRGKANELLTLNSQLLGAGSAPYENAFYHLGLGAAAFFNSDWTTASTHCDLAAQKFRGECRGAEYEAAVAGVFSVQALGQAGEVVQLIKRLPAAIQEADERGDLFAANNYRGGFHALGRIAAGQLDVVQADLQKVVETWTPGFYQMHAYHRVFAGVNADLYLGNPHSALARIDDDWQELKNGLFLTMELPAAELRWARARACLGVANACSAKKRRKSLITRVQKIIKLLNRSTIAAAQPHVAFLRAGIYGIENDTLNAIINLRLALTGYENARMAIHREVARWALSRILSGEESRLLAERCEAWQIANKVPTMLPLVYALAPGVANVLGNAVADE